MDIVKTAKEKCKKFTEWVGDNIIDIAGSTALLMVGGAGVWVIKKAAETSGVCDYAIYDKKNDWMCGCKRQLSNEELSEILKICRERHCSITEVLAEMDLRTSVYSDWK